MKRKRQKRFESEAFLRMCSSLFAILAGLFIGFVILLISHPSAAAEGMAAILTGGFSDGARGIGKTLYLATPIIMTGLSVGFAFKTGLFNIGASGQFTAGAFAAIYVAIRWTWLPDSIHWGVALLAAFIVGALLGIVPGILKAYLNVNEVITCIMMNYIAMYGVNMLIEATVYDKLTNRTLPVPAEHNVPSAGIGELFGGSSANLGIVIALLCAVLMHVILNKTIMGYELKACGKNRDAAQYAGINSGKNIVLSMAVAGALSGLGGALLYLSGSGKFLSVMDVLAAEGYTGISAALLGMSNPIGIIFAGLFIAHITVGGGNMQLFGFVPEVVDIITASIIYCGALSLLFKTAVTKLKSGRKENAV